MTVFNPNRAITEVASVDSTEAVSSLASGIRNAPPSTAEAIVSGVTKGLDIANATNKIFDLDGSQAAAAAVERQKQSLEYIQQQNQLALTKQRLKNEQQEAIKEGKQIKFTEKFQSALESGDDKLLTDLALASPQIYTATQSANIIKAARGQVTDPDQFRRLERAVKGAEKAATVEKKNEQREAFNNVAFLTGANKGDIANISAENDSEGNLQLKAYDQSGRQVGQSVGISASQAKQYIPAKDYLQNVPQDVRQQQASRQLQQKQRELLTAKANLRADPKNDLFKQAVTQLNTEISTLETSLTHDYPSSQVNNSAVSQPSVEFANYDPELVSSVASVIQDGGSINYKGKAFVIKPYEEELSKRSNLSISENVFTEALYMKMELNKIKRKTD